jgi:hypothetical protein
MVACPFFDHYSHKPEPVDDRTHCRYDHLPAYISLSKKVYFQVQANQSFYLEIHFIGHMPLANHRSVGISYKKLDYHYITVVDDGSCQHCFFTTNLFIAVAFNLESKNYENFNAMKNSEPLQWIDLLFLIGAGLFFFSCIATTRQVARTLEPGQAEASQGYMQARSLEEFSQEPVQLIGLNGRFGITDNFDAGIAHSFDISEDNGHMFNTLWADVKWQISNRKNEANRLTFSPGLLKGFVYNQEALMHFTSLPLYVSLPVNNRLTQTLMYRYELISDDKPFPQSESFNDPRHTFSLGLEYSLQEPNSSKWIPKLGIGLGFMNSLNGDSEGDNVFIIDFGFKLTSPAEK